MATKDDDDEGSSNPYQYVGGVAKLTGQAWGNRRGSKKTLEAEEKAREQGISLLDQLDWEPEYASQHVPTYQKTNSPIARSYLESLMLGQNPDATFEGATNARAIKAAQQRTTNNLYGDLGARAAQAAAVQQETPWKVTPPSRVIAPTALGASTSAAGFAAQEEQKRIQKLKDEMAAQGQIATDERARTGKLGLGPNFLSGGARRR
jgi:hypothetical protein